MTTDANTTGSTDGTTDQVVFAAPELLASHRYAEPLVVGGVRCHGGFDDDGAYMSPRTANRVPAIAAWQAKHRRDFGTEPLDLPLHTWPEHYPNVAQARFLIASGVPEPVIATLTRVGTVEGFGGLIRHSPIPDMRRVVDEDTSGTALAHLGSGLFEAHARDEAGHEDEGGHEHMWFAARDVAFENPVTEDARALMLERMGIVPPGGGAIDPAALARGGARQPPVARRRRLRPRGAHHTHGAAAADRDLRVPHLRVGRGAARRPRPRGR